MFLHSGASLHGHEYSPRPASNSPLPSPPNLRAPLLRSAFAPPRQRARTAADGTPAPVLRQRPASDYIPRDPSPVVRFREPLAEPPSTPTTHDGSISESELSDATLSVDDAVPTRPARSRRPRRAPHKNTCFHLGYPTPSIIGKTKVMQKVLRPRLLLQLQRVKEDGKLRPVLEVFPATRIAGPVVAPRLAKRFPAIFGIKRHLCYDDLVLVKRDDADLHQYIPESELDDSLEKRNLLAVYSPLKHSDEAEIVLEDGSAWVARQLANGSFDFVHTDGEGNSTTVRWARRRSAVATLTSPSPVPTASAADSAQVRYTFSIINPLTRRHPVLATLTPSTLKVQETYTAVSSSHARHPPITRNGRSLSVSASPSLTRAAGYTPSVQSSLGGTASDGEDDSSVYTPTTPDHDATQQTSPQVDDATKALINVTALWVALRSGWSQSYTPSSSTSSSNAPSESAPSTPAPSQRGRSRRNTWTTRSSTSDSPRLSDLPHHSSAAGEPSRIASCLHKRNSMPAPQPFDPTTYMTHPTISNNRSPNPSPAVSRTSTPTPSLISPIPLATPAVTDTRTPVRRTTSTGAAFMRRRRLEAGSSSHLWSTLPPPPSETTLVDAPAAAEEPRLREGYTGPVPTVSPSPSLSPLATPMPVAAPAVTVAPVEDGRGGGSDGSDARGKAKKGGVRGRLSRWWHKLAPSR